MNRELKDLTAVPESARRAMSKLETTLFITCQLGMVAKEGETPPQAVLPNDLGDAILATGIFKPEALEFFPMAVLLKRLQVFTPGTLYDPLLIAFLGLGISDRPGWSVLWAYTVFRRTVELGRPYTFDDWVNDFPMGPPTNEGAGEIWDAQKWDKSDGPRSNVESDNLLDRAWPWKVPQQAQAVDA